VLMTAWRACLSVLPTALTYRLGQLQGLSRVEMVAFACFIVWACPTCLPQSAQQLGHVALPAVPATLHRRLAGELGEPAASCAPSVPHPGSIDAS